MVAGFAGHGLGATPNAMANMSAVVQRFGPSKKPSSSFRLSVPF